MATLTVVSPRVVKGHMDKATLLIANGQSWDAGEFLNTDGSNGLTLVASGDGSAGGGIKYYALQTQADPANATTTEIVGVITPDQIWEGNLQSDDVTAQAIVGNRYAVQVTAGVLDINLDDTTNVGVEIVELASDYEPVDNSIGDTSGRVRFKFLTIAVEAAQG